MTTPSFRDVERLSAYLDGQLSQAKKTRLKMLLQSDPALATVLNELRQARTLLRRTPQRRTPRNFTLTPKMAGIRPPVPRAVPALSWASAVATLLFIFTLGTNLVGQLSFGAAAPMMAAAPAGMGGGQADNTQPEYGVGGGPAATQPPVNMTVLATPTAPAGMGGGQADNTQPEYGVGGGPAATQPSVNMTVLATPTAEASALMAPEATPPGVIRLVEPPSAQKARHEPGNVWPFTWLGLAVLLIGAAFLVRWLNKRAFLRKNSSNRPR